MKVKNGFVIREICGENEAVQKVQDAYNNSDIILDSENFAGEVIEIDEIHLSDTYLSAEFLSQCTVTSIGSPKICFAALSVYLMAVA